jgi:hypothetical protein
LLFQEHVDVVPGERRVERRLQLLVRRHRLDQVRRDQHDQFGFIVLELLPAEQSAKIGNGAKPGEGVELALRLGLQHAGDAERLAVAQLDRRGALRLFFKARELAPSNPTIVNNIAFAESGQGYFWTGRGAMPLPDGAGQPYYWFDSLR